MAIVEGTKNIISKSGSKPNLLFVFADQWRRHALGSMNEDPVLTPHLDDFAKEGIMFDNAVACSPICSPNRASLLTGRYPISTGVTRNDAPLPTEGVQTIAHMLKDVGYATGYIGKWHLDGGLLQNTFVPSGPRRQGFDFWYSNGCDHKHFLRCYWKNSPEPIMGEGWQPDHETDVAIDYIRKHDRRMPFALFVSWGPPHTGGGPSYPPEKGLKWIDGRIRFRYAAPEQFEQLYGGKNLPRRPNVPNNLAANCLPGYFGACSSLDSNFGRLMECLDEEDLKDDTIVVFTADHGEMMGSQGRMTKGIWFEESIGVPFIIRWPGHVRQRRENLIFNSVDVVPSLLGLMGAPTPSEVQGTDLSTVMLGQKMTESRVALITFDKGSETEPDRFWRALRTSRYTYVVTNQKCYESYGSRILYDNEADPYQMKPIRKGDGKDDLMDQLHRQLTVRLDSLGDDFLTRFNQE